MRAGPLSDPSVAALLEEAFVCAWEKKGAVECYRVKGMPGESLKVGGNILAYVCTPAGEVIHAMKGAWRPEDFLEELRWAGTLHRGMSDPKTGDPITVVRAAHRKRAVDRWRGAAHELLSTQALRPLGEVEKTFFETLLHETYQPDREIIIREVSASDYKALLEAMPRG